MHRAPIVGRGLVLYNKPASSTSNNILYNKHLPTRLPNATSIAGSQQSCHLSAQKRPQPLNRSGDKMDYRSFIRALKFQNRTRPSAAGLLWCWSYQNSFWRDVLDHQLGSYEDWGPMLFFWLSSNTQLMMQSRQRPNIDKGHGVDLRQGILVKKLLPRTWPTDVMKKLLWGSGKQTSALAMPRAVRSW